MGSRELIESLRRASEESIRILRKDAEREAEALQASLAETDRGIAQALC